MKRHCSPIEPKCTLQNQVIQMVLKEYQRKNNIVYHINNYIKTARNFQCIAYYAISLASDTVQSVYAGTKQYTERQHSLNSSSLKESNIPTPLFFINLF